MNILVCGGAGYIGAHMCKLLAAQGHSVTVFDNLSTGHAKAVQWGKLTRGDLLVRDDIHRVLSEQPFSAVMHFSAKSLVGESVSRPDLYYQNNVTGTANLLDAMVAHDIKTFIFSSTAAIYGMPEYTPIDEQHPKAPINPYGHTKLFVERILQDYEKAYGMRFISLRYFNAAGADPDAELGELHDPETHLIPNILQFLLGKKDSFQVYGTDFPTPDGTAIRDYIHVTDLADAHVLALRKLLTSGDSDAINLGASRGFSVLEVVKKVEEMTGLRVSFRAKPKRLGDVPVLLASKVKAEQRLGWRLRYSGLETIVETAWRWHKKVAKN